MSKLIICRGLPASGKTTWAKEEVRRRLSPEFYELTVVDSPPSCRVNRDDIREMLHNGTFIKGVTEDVVIATRDATIRAALKKGWDVISDDTNLRSRNVRDLMKIAAQCGAEVEFNDSFLEVSVEECIHRDKVRPSLGQRYVGEEVIRDNYNKFLRGKSLSLPIPELEDTPTFAPLEHGEMPAMIVDIDGTVAHNNGHRGWYEYESVKKDEPHKNTIRVIQNNIAAGVCALFVSGRNDRCRGDTADWIWEHVLKDLYPHDVTEDPYPYPELLRGPNNEQWGLHKLFMREDGDHRRDDLVKYEIYRDYISPYFRVIMVWDDRNQVVEMWRQVGLTVSQVADGDF